MVKRMVRKRMYLLLVANGGNEVKIRLTQPRDDGDLHGWMELIAGDKLSAKMLRVAANFCEDGEEDE